MHDVGVVEGAQHLADGVRLPDVGQELVAQSLSLTGTPHDPGDIHELDGGWHKLRGPEHLGELLQS